MLTSGCFDALAKVSEAFVFIYLGMALLAFPIFSHHTLWLLTLVSLVACLLGRLHVFPLLWLAARLQRCGGGAEARHPASQAPLRLRPKHAVCIWFSGLRGGVAFALAAASYEARDFPMRCGGRPALAAAADHAQGEGEGEGEGELVSHCPRELNDSLAIVQATLLLAVFTIFVFGAAARDVALLCGALPQPSAGRAGGGVDSARVDECAELTLDEPTGEASDAELEARRGAVRALPASSRWNTLNARLVLLLTRQKAPLRARAPRPLNTMDSDADNL